MSRCAMQPNVETTMKQSSRRIYQRWWQEAVSSLDSNSTPNETRAMLWRQGRGHEGGFEYGGDGEHLGAMVGGRVRNIGRKFRRGTCTRTC